MKTVDLATANNGDFLFFSNGEYQEITKIKKEHNYTNFDYHYKIMVKNALKNGLSCIDFKRDGSVYYGAKSTPNVVKIVRST